MSHKSLIQVRAWLELTQIKDSNQLLTLKGRERVPQMHEMACSQFATEQEWKCGGRSSDWDEVEAAWTVPSLRARDNLLWPITSERYKVVVKIQCSFGKKMDHFYLRRSSSQVYTCPMSLFSQQMDFLVSSANISFSLKLTNLNHQN